MYGHCLDVPVVCTPYAINIQHEKTKKEEEEGNH